MTHALDILGWVIAVLAIAGSAYTALAAILVLRFFHAGPAAPPARVFAAPPRVTLLKPLHGDEPGLQHNLQSFFDQAQAGRAEIVFGVQDPADPAVAVVERLQARNPGVASRLCVDPERRGANPKVSNLIGMAGHARGDILVLSDSDIEAPPSYLAKVLEALGEPGVGIVTCPYLGRGEAGFWSVVAAMGLSHGFMPNVVTGVGLGMAKPCMGSTIALRRETLAQVGGLEAFRDTLADDYRLGEAVRRLGLRSVLVPMLVVHSCAETTAREVLAHELRWARTVKIVDPPGHLGSVVTHPLPLALAAATLTGLAPAALAIVALALVARLALAAAVDRVADRATGPLWLLPLRDVLSFAVFVGSLFGGAVSWRGETLAVTADGDLISAQGPDHAS